MKKDWMFNASVGDVIEIPKVGTIKVIKDTKQGCLNKICTNKCFANQDRHLCIKLPMCFANQRKDRLHVHFKLVKPFEQPVIKEEIVEKEIEKPSTNLLF